MILHLSLKYPFQWNSYSFLDICPEVQSLQSLVRSGITNNTELRATPGAHLEYILFKKAICKAWVPHSSFHFLTPARTTAICFSNNLNHSLNSALQSSLQGSNPTQSDSEIWNDKMILSLLPFLKRKLLWCIHLDDSFLGHPIKSLFFDFF